MDPLDYDDEKETELERALGLLDPVAEAVRNPNIWVVSCRSVRSRNEFSKRVLMYQPDIRNFCPHGSRCTLRDDEVHCALYIHEKRSRDKSETVIENPHPTNKPRESYDADSRADKSELYVSSTIGGMPFYSSNVFANKMNPKIPHVANAWQLGFSKSKMRNFKGTSRINGFPTGKTFVLFCHGFGERFRRIIAYLLHMSKVLELSSDSASDVNLLAFTWPSQRVAPSYLRARVFAEQAGKILRRTIQLLSLHNNRIILIGHSLGCRVCLSALLDFKYSSPVEHLFLLAAGVGADEMSVNGAFPANRVGAKRITVCYSAKDPIKVGFGFAELIPGVWNLRPHSILAMAAVGLRGKTPTNENGEKICYAVNCTSEVPHHSVHFYFKSQAFSNLLKSSVSHVKNLQAGENLSRL